MPYKHITAEERIKIETLRKEGFNKNEIALRLCRHRSSIGRELERNFEGVGGKYQARAAERRRKRVRITANAAFRKLTLESDLVKRIDEKISLYWSPEQIAGRLRLENHGVSMISAETIYTYIYTQRKDLLLFLRHGHKRRYRRRHGTKQRENRREEAKKQRIDVRPDIVSSRSRLGDWEGDTIVGQEKTVHLLTHVDRKSGVLLLNKLNQATAEQTTQITITRFKKLKKRMRHTITYDNGVQFSKHEIIHRDLHMDIFFAHPYHSWERGTNENTNGLVRQFFPKGSPFTPITEKQIESVEHLINSRPRKRHGYHTPLEVFS
jgi:transposase, IS30 family